MSRLGEENNGLKKQKVSCYEEYGFTFSTSISMFVIVFFSHARCERKIGFIMFGSIGGNGLTDLRCLMIFEWDYVGPAWS
jgi:hypothetical protein